MPRTPTRRTTEHRLVGLAIAAGVAIAVLAVLPIPWPPDRPDDLIDWWESTGTASATMSFLRAIAIAFAAWILAVTTFGLMAGASRWRPARRVWQSTTPRAIRRFAVASAVMVGASIPDAVLGSDAAEPPPVVRDLGAADPDAEPIPPMLHDLGPVDDVHGRPPVAEPTAPEPQPADDVWIVERGDHLWLVAEETLAERGETTTEPEITRYWLEVIALNRGEIGPDPDLILPGMVLLLP